MEICIDDKHDVQSVEVKLYKTPSQRPDFGDVIVTFKGSGDKLILSFTDPEQTLAWFDAIETVQQFLCGGAPEQQEEECLSSPSID